MIGCTGSSKYLLGSKFKIEDLARLDTYFMPVWSLEESDFTLPRWQYTRNLFSLSTSDFTLCEETRTSIFLCKSVVYMISRKQSYISRTTTEVESDALLDVITKVAILVQVLQFAYTKNFTLKYTNFLSVEWLYFGWESSSVEVTLATKRDQDRIYLTAISMQNEEIVEFKKTHWANLLSKNWENIDYETRGGARE